MVIILCVWGGYNNSVLTLIENVFGAGINGLTRCMERNTTSTEVKHLKEENETLNRFLVEPIFDMQK